MKRDTKSEADILKAKAYLASKKDSSGSSGSSGSPEEDTEMAVYWYFGWCINIDSFRKDSGRDLLRKKIRDKGFLQLYCRHPLLREYKGGHTKPGFISKATTAEMIVLLENVSKEDRKARNGYNFNLDNEEYRSVVFSDFVYSFGRELTEGDTTNASAFLPAI